jgi:hypothetical protein
VTKAAADRRNLTLALGVALGYALWVTWVFLGKGSPLDGGARYLALLFVAGAGLAAIQPADPWPGPVGLYVGQAMGLSAQAFLGLGGDPHAVPLRLLYLVSVTLAAALGAGFTAGVRIWLQDAVKAR